MNVRGMCSGRVVNLVDDAGLKSVGADLVTGVSNSTGSLQSEALKLNIEGSSLQIGLGVVFLGNEELTEINSSETAVSERIP